MDNIIFDTTRLLRGLAQRVCCLNKRRPYLTHKWKLWLIDQPQKAI